MIKWRLFGMKYFWNYILAITTKRLQDILNLYISNLKNLTYIYIQQYYLFTSHQSQSIYILLKVTRIYTSNFRRLMENHSTIKEIRLKMYRTP